MKTNKNQIAKQTIAAVIGWSIAAGLAASVHASGIPVIVNDVTDWGTTPVEVVNANLPYLGYYGGVYAGINTLAVTVGGNTTTYGGFCIDPFHWSANGPTSGYYEVPLVQAPKSPATMNAATAMDIEELWQEYYSPTMSSSSAAGLQIAIWELVSANAVANDGLSANEAFSLPNGQNDYGASADIASLATYTGPLADLMGLTGPGQDYVIDVGPPNPHPPSQVADDGATFIMLAMALGALVLARPAILQAIPVKRLMPVQVQG
jgi:hypothetical protein